jgi:hypothetical protein
MREESAYPYFFFRRRIFITRAVTPPVDTTLLTTNPALAMHAGHMVPLYFRAFSARVLMPSFIFFQPSAMPFRCSSGIAPKALW